MYWTYTITGTFNVTFHLHRFPLDTQCLRMECVVWGSPHDAVTQYDDDGQARCALFQSEGPRLQSRWLPSAQQRDQASPSLFLLNHPIRSRRSRRSGRSAAASGSTRTCVPSTRRTSWRATAGR